MAEVKLLVRELTVSDTDAACGGVSVRYSLVYLTGWNLSGVFGNGSVMEGCRITPFDREQAGVVYIASLGLEKTGEGYRVSYISR